MFTMALCSVRPNGDLVYASCNVVITQTSTVFSKWTKSCMWLQVLVLQTFRCIYDMKMGRDASAWVIEITLSIRNNPFYVTFRKTSREKQGFNRGQK